VSPAPLSWRMLPYAGYQRRIDVSVVAICRAILLFQVDFCMVCRMDRLHHADPTGQAPAGSTRDLLSVSRMRDGTVNDERTFRCMRLPWQ
jgi:hypothetical protein